VVPQGSLVLDVGCGAGQTLIAAYPGGHCYGLDLDLEALQLGRSLSRDVNFVQGRSEAMPYTDAKFDFVIARVSLAYTNISQSLREIRRVLKPGGVVWMVLHPFEVPWKAVKHSSWKGKLFFVYIVLNSLLFHFLGHQIPWFGRYESFQTERGIKRTLRRAGFSDITITRDRFFVATARV
jgi:ubiquinone/menaquinone biosynthesis C-methylase UbiE